MQIQCKELRRVQSAEPTAVSRPGKHPMHEAEATILQMFAKRGYKGACLKGRLLAQAVVHRRLGVLLPPSACSDSMHGCVVRNTFYCCFSSLSCHHLYTVLSCAVLLVLLSGLRSTLVTLNTCCLCGSRMIES